MQAKNEWQDHQAHDRSFSSPKVLEIAHEWKIAAYFSMATHFNLYDSNMRFLSENVRDLLLKRLTYMRETENTMHSINLLSSIMMPRTVQNRRDASVYVLCSIPVQHVWRHCNRVLRVAPQILDRARSIQMLHRVQSMLHFYG
jgi:hypothetical protein